MFIVFRFLFILFSIVIYAQNPILLIGNVKDKASGKSIEYATISLLKSSDSSFVAGTVTDSTGSFKLPINLGKWVLRADFIGYRKKNISVSVEMTDKDISVSTIFLEDHSNQLNEVVVEGQKDFVQNTIEKQIYNVDKLGTVQGGNAADILQNIPSVTIDQEGTPSLRGTNVIVLIDGRPSGISGQSRSALLDQIPASSIDRIEVISNPSARYDPDGMSGIINIILKKNNKAGYNGNTSLTVGDREKYNFSFNFNFKKGKLNTFLNYSYNHNKYYGLGSSFRKNLYMDTLYYIKQEQTNDNVTDVHMAKVGMDYFFNPSNSLTSTITLNTRSNKLVNEVFSNTRLDSTLNPTSFFDRVTNRNIKGIGVEWANNYTHNFSKKGNSISIDANISSGKEDILYNIIQLPSTSIYAQELDGDTAYKSLMPELGKNHLIILQSDYSHGLNESNRIDVGVKSSYRVIDRNYAVNDFNFNSETYVLDILKSNHFNYKEHLYSVYLIYGGRKGKWSYQAGARAEQAYTLSYLITSESKFRNNYFNIFPSATISYKPLSILDFKLAYSRRIVRPDIQNLNPFINYADRFNLRKGNPYLQPEYVNSLELGTGIQVKKITLNATLYYRQSTNLIWRVRTLERQGVSMIGFQNIPGSETKGLELVNSINVIKWLSLNNSFNIFNRSIFVGDVIVGATSRNTNSWNWKLLSTLKPFKGTEITLAYTYDSPIITPQGKILPFQGTDISIRKDLFKKKATIAIRFSDIFNTRKFRMEMFTDQFTDDFMRKRESRNVFVTLTWKFGSEEGFGKRQEKKKGLNTETQGEDSP